MVYLSLQIFIRWCYRLLKNLHVHVVMVVLFNDWHLDGYRITKLISGDPVFSPSSHTTCSILNSCRDPYCVTLLFRVGVTLLINHRISSRFESSWHTFCLCFIFQTCRPRSPHALGSPNQSLSIFPYAMFLEFIQRMFCTLQMHTYINQVLVLYKLLWTYSVLNIYRTYWDVSSATVRNP